MTKYLYIFALAFFVYGCAVPIPKEMSRGKKHTFKFSDATVDVYVISEERGFKSMATNANLEITSSPNLKNYMLQANLEAMRKTCSSKIPKITWQERPNVLWTSFTCQLPTVSTASFQSDAKTFPTSPVNVQFRLSQINTYDVAVIIGNADYEKGKDIPDVTPAYADANGIRRYVRQALGVRKENIIFLKDATQAEMTSTFGTKDNPKGQLYNYVTPGKSRVFVYYSGHGAPGGKDGDSYLVPSNAQASTIDLNGYPLKTLYRNLSKIPAKSMTVVLEACFSGASQAGSVISKASPIYLKAKDTGVPANITLIAAGAANQIASWEEDKSSGLFTEYFLKGMSGKADAKPYGNGDGKVGYAELGRYLKGTLTYYARRYYGRDQTAQIVVGE